MIRFHVCMDTKFSKMRKYQLAKPSVWHYGAKIKPMCFSNRDMHKTLQVLLEKEFIPCIKPIKVDFNIVNKFLISFFTCLNHFWKSLHTTTHHIFETKTVGVKTDWQKPTVQKNRIRHRQHNTYMLFSRHFWW